MSDPTPSSIPTPTTFSEQLSTADAAVIRRDLQHFANAGHLSREQANVDLRQLGLEPLAPVADESHPDDQPSEPSAPPAPSPGAYRLPRLSPGHAPSPQDITETRALAFAMHEAQLPVAIGSGISSQIEASARRYANLGDLERRSLALKSQSTLARKWGDAAPAKIAAAKQLVQHMEATRPGVVALLERTGAGNDPLVITMLADAAMRRARKASP